LASRYLLVEIGHRVNEKGRDLIEFGNGIQNQLKDHTKK
jgi:hypothetical protein